MVDVVRPDFHIAHQSAPTLEIAGCRRLFDHPVDGVWASDRFGVCADLAVPDADAP